VSEGSDDFDSIEINPSNLGMAPNTKAPGKEPLRQKTLLRMGTRIDSGNVVNPLNNTGSPLQRIDQFAKPKK